MYEFLEETDNTKVINVIESDGFAVQIKGAKPQFLLDGIFDSDGWDRCQISTVSETLLNNIIEITHKLGLEITYKIRHTNSKIDGRRLVGDSYLNCISKTRRAVYRKNNLLSQYRGTIWCLEIPENRNFLVERNGRFAFSGNTAEVYGTSQEPLKETHLCDARSPYAASKYAGERYCLSYWATYGVPEITIVRGFNTFGPRQSYGAKGAVIAIFITQALMGIAPTIYGDGEQSRDYVYVKDMARGIVAAALKRGIGGEVINLASGRTESVNEIADAVLKLTAPKLTAEHIAPRAGEVHRSCGDPSKARWLLGWEAETDFYDGLRETVEYFRRGEKN